MSVKEKNLAVLNRLRPDLLALCKAGNKTGVESVVSKSSLLVFRYRGVAFHSLYKPEEEAVRFAETVPSDVKKIWVFGLGYAYHLRNLLNRKIEITVLEPCAEIFNSAVENVDITAVIEKCRLVVGNQLSATLENADLENATLLIYRPYVRFFEAEFLKIESSFTVRSFIQKKGLHVMLAGPIYGGSLPTFRYVAEALENLGAKVSLFDSALFSPAYFDMGRITPNELHSRQLKGVFAGMLGEGIVAMADNVKPDLVLVMAQAPLDVSAIKRIKELGITLAYWFVENFRTMKYWERVAPLCDYFFTIQRGEFFEKLAKIGARKISYLPQAASPATHKPLELTEREREYYGSDISFMGAGYPNRRQFFRGLLDRDFKIWGTEWELETEVGKIVQNKNTRLSPEEYIKIFCASKINLNLHSSTMQEGIDPVSDFVNPRVFEVSACGGFSIVDARDELAQLMEPGKEIETFSNLPELREKLDYYLARPEERQKIARAGRKRVLEEHTFERRMEELLKIIILNEGESLGGKAANGYSRNVVGRMIKEGSSNSELVEFLGGLNPEKKLDIAGAVKKIRAGNGALTRTELIFLMMDELLV